MSSNGTSGGVWAAVWPADFPVNQGIQQPLRPVEGVCLRLSETDQHGTRLAHYRFYQEPVQIGLSVKGYRDHHGDSQHSQQGRYKLAPSRPARLRRWLSLVTGAGEISSSTYEGAV